MENGQNQHENQNQNQYSSAGKQNRTMLWIIAGLGIVILALAIWFIISSTSQKRALEEAISLKEQAELDMMQRDLQNDYDQLNSEFTLLENSRQLILDDSVKRELQQKYDDARLQIEKLNQELKNQKTKSAKEIQQLKDEISTLRNLLRHYVEEINRLNLENQQLRSENEQVKTKNQELSNRVQQTAAENENLNKRMTLAEKLNVTGLSIQALNKKGKEEKKVSKAKQLMVRFTIPQNNSTPVGEKTIFLRIVSPSGQLLGGSGSFPFEGSSVPYTAKKVVEYAGEEIGGVTIYWDVNTALTAGQYTVELFSDNYRLISRNFELK